MATAAYAITILPPPGLTIDNVHTDTPPLHNYRVMPTPKVPRSYLAYERAFTPMLQKEELPSRALRKKMKRLKLTLQDAILLALRYQPAVESDELDRVAEKYAFIIARREFVPKYSLTGGANFPQTGKSTFTITPSVSIKTPIGTQIDFGYANTFPNTGGGSDFGTFTFTLTQPLIRGAGFVNEIDYLNAIDTAESDRLNFKGSIISTVVGIISAYRQLVEDENSLITQKQNLKASQEITRQYELRVKAGQMAPSQLIQQNANYATDKFQYVTAVTNLEQSERGFLDSLGLTLNANVSIDRKIVLGNYKIPSERQAIETALRNNPGYLAEVISLHAVKRAILTAEDARLPKLDFQLTQTFGQGVGGTQQMIAPPFLNRFVRPKPMIGGFGSVNADTLATLTFDIPIDDVEAKSAVIEARIAMEQKDLSLQQDKQKLIRTIMNDLTNVKNGREQVILGEESVKLLKQTWEDAKLRQQYGKTTVFEVTQDQNNFVNQQLTQISTEIAYLNDITTLNQDMGITLHQWNIKLRY